nr:MAG TPA: Tail fiber protein [Caudoviricetes sp.]
MLGVNQLDFINYANALKGNYRKGVHKMEAIMASPTHAKEFASNLGGVSVVLSVPIGKEDRNSAQLLDLLLNSDVADDAVYTWLGQFYEFSSWDDLLGDESRCNEIMNDPLKSRAVSGSGVAVGKMVATIAGLSCSAYADMSAVAASSTAMAAIEKSQTAKGAIAASDMATAKYAAGAAGLNPADYANMAAIASSSTAMTAIANNKTAITAVEASAVAKNALYNSPLKTSISNIASTSSWTTRRNGKIWLISFRQMWGSGNTSMQHRSTLKDGGTVSCTASQSYNTDYRIDRFMDSITNYNSAGGIGNVCTYYFIPC